MSFQRARQDEQKAERRVNIIDTARSLCSEQGVMGWSLNELGRRASVTKSNLYTYFSNKEEILLAIMNEETSLFTKIFIDEVSDKSLGYQEISNLMADIYSRNPLLCELISISSTVLENNIALERARNLKRAPLENSNLIAQAITKTNPTLNFEQASQIAFTSGIIVAGLWPLAKENAPMQQLATYEGFETLAMDFKSTLQQMLSTYISGLQQ